MRKSGKSIMLFFDWKNIDFYIEGHTLKTICIFAVIFAFFTNFTLLMYFLAILTCKLGIVCFVCHKATYSKIKRRSQDNVPMSGYRICRFRDLQSQLEYVPLGQTKSTIPNLQVKLLKIHLQREIPKKFKNNAENEGWKWWYWKIRRSCRSLAIFWPHLGFRMSNMGVEEAKDTIMGGVQCLNALLLAPKSQIASK